MPKYSTPIDEMGTTKTLSTNELKRITGVSQKQYKQVPWHTTTVVIKRLLTINEYMDTIQGIIKDCRTPDDGIAIELLDFATRINIISAYAFVELPKNIDELYYIVYASDLYDLVCSVANTSQIDSIKKSVSLLTN